MTYREASDKSNFLKQRDILSKKMPQLDGMRGLAISYVIFHSVTSGDYVGGVGEKIFNFISNGGWVGVQLFFVLSGFLITGILIDGKGAESQLRNFYMRRVLRIFPLYYTVLLAFFVFLPAFNIIPNWLRGDFDNQVWYWVYLVNWAAPFLENPKGLGHFWSLAVEEQFYLVWPFLIVNNSSKMMLRLCVALVVIGLLCRLILTYYFSAIAAHAAYTFTFARCDSLAVGAVAAFMVRDEVGCRYIEQFNSKILIILVFYYGLYLVLFRDFGPVSPGLGVVNQTVVALIFGMCLLASISPEESKNWLGRFVSGVMLRNIGKYSYAMYVFQLPLKHVLDSFWCVWLGWGSLVGESLKALAVFVGAYLLAWISWRLVEQPFLNLKRYFSDVNRVDFS